MEGFYGFYSQQQIQSSGSSEVKTERSDIGMRIDHKLRRFTGDVDEELVCPICCEVLEDPLQVPGCEHVFCGRCITDWIKEKPTCPVDRFPIKPNELQPVPRIIRNLLSKLSVSCDNATYGCPASLKLEDLPSHLAHCEYDPKRPVQCENCCLNIPMSVLTEHNCVRELRSLLEVQQDRLTEFQKDFQRQLVELRMKINDITNHAVGAADASVEQMRSAAAAPSLEQMRSAARAACVEHMRSAAAAASIAHVRSAAAAPSLEQMRSAARAACVEHMRSAAAAASIAQMRSAARAACVEHMRSAAAAASIAHVRSAAAAPSLEQMRSAARAACVEHMRSAAAVASADAGIVIPSEPSMPPSNISAPRRRPQLPPPPPTPPRGVPPGAFRYF